MDTSENKLKIDGLSVILNSIGEGLILTDGKGKITFVNKVAQQLTGWDPADALGNSLEKVFNIQNESSGQKTENPIAKVLRGDMEQGTKNHTLLLSKDGSKIPVENSATPIQDPAGKTTGAVLIFRDISKRRKVEEELKKVDALKTGFISSVSHELRTPLAIIKEGINLVIDQIPGKINNNQRELLSTVRNNVDRLVRIIGALLDISKIESGKLELEIKPLAFIETLKPIISSFDKAAKEKNLILKTNFPVEDIQVYGDKEQIKSIFLHLITNALRYTLAGSIEISIKELERVVECTIEDTGIGISNDELSKAFDKFHQIGRIPGDGEKGTGLGLSIAKGLIEAHSGKIQIESQLGKGTKIVFTLPK